MTSCAPAGPSARSASYLEAVKDSFAGDAPAAAVAGAAAALDPESRDGTGQPTPRCLVESFANPLRLVQYVFFTYIYALLRVSSRKAGTLAPEDLWHLSPLQESQRLANSVGAVAGPTPVPPWRAFLRAFGLRLSGIAFMVLIDIALASGAPFVLIKIVRELNEPTLDRPAAFLAAFGLSLLTITRTLILHTAFFNAWRVGQGGAGLRAKGCICGPRLDRPFPVSRPVPAAQTCGRRSWGPCSAS